MENDIDKIDRGRKNGKVVAGFFLLVAGGLLLIQQMGDIFFPSWLFSWPMWLIVIGLYTGVKHNFSKPTPIIMIVVGVIFLSDDIFPGFRITHLFWPAIIICIGLIMIMGKNQKWDRKSFKRNLRGDDSWKRNQQFDWDKKVNPDEPISTESAEPKDYSKINYSDIKGDFNEDYLDCTSIFGSAHKTIFSKNFKGGEIVNIFGGAEIDFTQSDINGKVVIDVTQIFGGIKLLVPPHWHVTSDTVSLFAGFDDKRKIKTATSNDKLLIITGTSIFAGVEIRSY